MAFLAFLAGPIGRWLIVAALVAAAVFATYAKVKGIGWDERDAIAQAEAAEMQRQAAILAGQRAAVSAEVVTKYVDRVRVVTKQGEEVVREVVRYIPVATPDLPGGFRVLHDAAVSGQIPRATGGTDAAGAAPVPVTVATETIASNYSTCNLNAEQLTALQEWASRQRKLELRRRQLGGDP